MNARTTLIAASVALLAFAGCGSDRNDGGNDAGCTTCTTDSGTDSGTPDSGQPDSGQPDSGEPDSGTPDGGPSACTFIPHSDGGLIALSMSKDIATPVTLAQLRYGKPTDGGNFNAYGSHVSIEGAVVQTVSYVASDGGTSQFWIVDPNDPTTGFWVYHRGTDTAYVPVAGDVVNVDGFLNSDPKYYEPDGYRYNLGNLFSGGTVQKVLDVEKTGSGTVPADNIADSGCTFDAQEGARYFPQTQQAFAGTRLHIAGPLTLTNPNPVALGNVRLEQDGGATITSYRGFEVTGGILVATSNTYNADGGFGDQNGRCDWAELARADAGVTFPDGISGVWDTFTNTVCDVQASGECNSYAPNGYIPNPTTPFPTRASDGGVVLPNGNENYTFVLYPQDCADLPGDAGSGVTP